MPKILIVDDEQPMRQLIDVMLKHNGFETRLAENAEQAMAHLQMEDIDAILLDVMMPGRSGFELVEDIRIFSHVPIVLLTALDASEDKVRGLRLGADDYMVKPFSEEELIARIEALLRRSGNFSTEATYFVSGCIKVDEEARKVVVENQPVELTYKEFELLCLFIHHPNKAYSREQLLELLWDVNYIGGLRTVDTHIKTLRLKLGKVSKRASEAIQTVWGIGYRYEIS